MKTSKLTGAALDWAVAKCEDQPVLFDGKCVRYAPGQFSEEEPFTPSTDWAQGGPIVEREGIHLLCNDSKDEWTASAPRPNLIGWRFIQNGPTPLIAAMRCCVASKLGDEVEIPEELKP